MEYDRRGQKKTEQDEAPSCLLMRKPGQEQCHYREDKELQVT